MEKFSKKRWQKLAGILLEGDVVSLDDYREKKQRAKYENAILLTTDGQITADPEDWLFAKLDNEDQADAIINGEIEKAEELGARFYAVGPGHEVESRGVQENVKKPNNKKPSITEKTSQEFTQDFTAYFGTNDSIDGPYNKVSENQPFNDHKHRKEYLKKIKAENILREEEYPDTASEYADKLNKKKQGPFKLVTDQDFWEDVNVYSGRDLARYLAIEAHHNAYKELRGIRPRHVNYDNYSIEEIEEMTDDLYREQEEFYKRYEPDPDYDMEL